MKQVLLKTWLILVCLLTGAGTMWGAALGTGYTKITNITSLSAGDAVVLYCDNSSSGVTGYSGSDATVSTTASDWIQFVVEKNGSNYYLKNPSDNKYVTKQTSNKFTITATSASGNEVTVNNNGVLCINSRYLVQNGSYYRMYSSVGSYQGVFVYKVLGGSTSTTYNVTISDNIANGTVTASPSSAAEGATVTLTATPETGYEFGSWNVTNASTSAAITVTGNKFTMPAANVNVSATFNQIQGGGDEPSGEGTTYNFAEMTDFSSWGSSYEKKTTTFSDGAYVELASANKNTSTITDCPVTKGGDVIFKAPEGKKITSLTFTCTQWGTKTQTITLNTSSNGTDYTATSTTSSNFVLSASNLTDVTAVKFTFSSASNQVGIKSIKVTYADGGEDPDPDQPSKTTPSLSFENATYNATMGEAFTAPTLTNEEGVPVTYSASNVTPANCIEVAEDGTVTINAAGSATITASFAGNDDYNAASASYTLIVAAAPAPALMTMDEIYAKAQEVNGTETEVRVTLNNWVVSGVNDSNAYVTDGTKGFIIYKSGHNFVAGDILSGTVSAKIKLFNGAAEFTTITSTTDGLTVTKGGSVSEQAIAIADLAGINTGALVAYEGLTYHLNGTSAEFSDGENVIVAYKGIMNALPELVEGKTYDVKGIFLMYGTKKEILPRYAEDVVLKENINNYTISYATTENGTIVVKNGDTPLKDGAEVAEGTKLTIECTPVSEDYRFVNWQYKEEGMDAFATRTKDFTYTMPSANVQFKANFELIPVYDVTYMSLGKVAGSEKVKEGEKIANAPSVTLTDWDFVGWTTNESYTDSETSPVLFNDVIKASITLYAVFSQGENGVAGSASLTNQEICDNVAGSYADGSITNTYGTWNYNAAKQGNVSKDGEYFLQLRNNATISYLQIPEMAGNITSIVLGRVCNTSKAQYTGSIYFRSEKSNDATAIATATQSTALTDVTLTIPDGYKTGYVMVSGACRIESVTVNYTTGGSKTYTITGPLPAVLSISEAGYATYYNAYPYVMPAGLTGLTMEPNGNNGIKGEARYAAGDVVPAETALLIKGAKNDYTLNVASEEGETYKDNLLHGLLVEGTTTGGGEGAKYYKFSNGDHGYGWYYHGSTNTTGAPFTIAANKAYLVLESNMTSSSARFIAIDGEDTLTAIDGLDTDVTNTEIYDLAGRRVQRVNNGMYILNGKKVIF